MIQQITNQLVMSCKKSINSYLHQCDQKSNNIVWNGIEMDIDQSLSSTQSIDFSDSPVKTKRGMQHDDSVDFLHALNSCLVLHKQYRDQLRNLRDSLGGSHLLQHVPATSFSHSVKKYASPSLGNVSVASNKAHTYNLSPSLPSKCQLCQ